jgi:hypothetical protein
VDRVAAWEQARRDAKDRFKESGKQLKESRKLLEEAQSDKSPEQRWSKLPYKTNITAFKPGLRRTQRDVDEFFANFERVMKDHNMPRMEHGKRRWYDGLSMAFEKGLGTDKLDPELLDWLANQQDNHDWDVFKEHFAERFVGDKTFSSAKARYDRCRKKQGQTVADFFRDFKACAKAACFNTEPPANWSSSMSTFADVFMERLRPELAKLITSDNAFATEVATDLEKLKVLAQACEARLVLQRNVEKRRQHDRGGADNKKQRRAPKTMRRDAER